MRALIVFESMYGNTRAIAEAIAEGMGADAGVTVLAVHEAGPVPADVELLVVGGPTHMHGLSTSMSRGMAATAAKEDAAELDPSATQEPGLRHWLRDLERRGGSRAAAFDTRADAKAALTGSAARGIARRLRQNGYDVVGRESFLVEDAEGPLEAGELERARAWGANLASS
jgi:Flavodoxin domain